MPFLRCAGYVPCNGRRTMNWKFGRVWMKANLAYCKAVYQYFTGGSGENHEKLSDAGRPWGGKSDPGRS
jgi:hypothetical protein